MEIISHRGLWKTQNEKNSKYAFEHSFSLSFGTETDIRDFNGKLVISHDIPSSHSLLFEDFLDLYNKSNCKKTLALNIKADGLQKELIIQLDKHQIQNYFVFDASIPDSISYLNMGINFFTRQSEFELNPAFYEKCDGVWLDSFDSLWFDFTLIKNHLNFGKKVAIVSPELHNNDYKILWNLLKQNNAIMYKNLILCTDFPEKAKEYFYK